jgi:hypothetical protein
LKPCVLHWPQCRVHVQGLRTSMSRFLSFTESDFDVRECIIPAWHDQIRRIECMGTTDDHPQYRTLLTQVETQGARRHPRPGFRAGKISSIEAPWSNFVHRTFRWKKLKYVSK